MKSGFKKFPVLFLVFSLMLSNICYVASAEDSSTQTPVTDTAPQATESPAHSAESVVAELGDVTADGNINANDALDVLKYAAKLKSLDEAALKRADVTADTSINASDALNILKYAARIIPDFSQESINATPIPTPTPPAEVENQNVKKIKDFIIENGDTDSEGTKYVSYEYIDEPIYTSIYYSEKEDYLIFDLTYMYPSESGELGFISTSMLYGLNESEFSYYVAYEYGDIQQYYEALCTVATNSVAPDTKFNFKEYSSAGCTDEEKSQIHSLASDYATTALYLWDDVLKSELNTGLSDIGFTGLVYE